MTDIHTGFRPTGLGDTIFRERYAREGETWEDACRRVARAVATAEENGKAAKYEERFYGELVNGRFMPGGRIWYGAGRKVQQMLNCFVIPVEDTIEGWGRSVSDMMTVSSRGGGVGGNFSPLRGRGYPIGGMGGESTGAVSLMKIWNEVGENLVGGGGRRLALMQCLEVNHPDIEEFMDAKLIDPDDKDKAEKKLSNANISVVIPDDLPTEEFQRLVREDGDIELRWGGLPDKLGRTISARKVWERIVYNAWASGEPGVLNSYEANKMNNVAYHWPLISTNPCLTGDTWVMTVGGPRRIIDLIGVNTTVQVDGKGYTSPEGFFETGTKSVYTLSTKEGYSVNLTADHRVLLEDGEWVEAQNLREGDKVRLNNHDKAPYWHGHGTKEEGYIVGHFLGDGTWDYGKARICSWGEGDAEVQVRASISSILSKDWTKQKSGAHFIKDDSIVSKYLEAGAKEITDVMQTASSSFNYGFLRGLFDTDGHVEGNSTKGGISIRLSQSNFDFLADIQRILLRFGIRSKINMAREASKRMMPDGQGGYKEYDTKTNWRLIITSDADRFMKYIGFGNADKSNKFNELRKAMTRGFYEKPFSVTFEAFEYVGEEKVYDITVPEVHAFDANGLYVHNCGEIWLPAYGCCDLGALVLSRFVVDGKMDWDALEQTIRLGVRFLDDVLDVNHYPLPQIEKVCKEERRIGLGVMGLHSMLLDMGMKYNSDEAYAFVDKLFGFIKNTAYDESVTLSAEKGPFQAYAPEFTNSGFMKTIKPAIRRKIKHHGIRNCALLTIAPTGTTAMVQNDTGGIEPLFAPCYIRRRKVSIGGGKTKIVETLVVSREYLDHPDVAQGAYDITPRDHMQMQKVVQKHIDNAVSKTINLPKEYPVEELADLWLEYLPYMKGSTFYREGSRGEEPMQHVPADKIQETLSSWDGEVEYEMAESMECPDGSCEVKYDDVPPVELETIG